jgi:hypothetical protein
MCLQLPLSVERTSVYDVYVNIQTCSGNEVHARIEAALLTTDLSMTLQLMSILAAFSVS